MNDDEFDPTPADLQQAEEGHVAPLPPIPVTNVDPVRTQTLPSRQGGFRNYTLTLAAPAVRILDSDPRRRRAVLQVFDTAGVSDGAMIGPTQAGASTGFLLALPGPNIAAGNVVSEQLEITSTGELWAQAAVATCVLSVMNEQWAD